jgi:hypothetical protein
MDGKPAAYVAREFFVAGRLKARFVEFALWKMPCAGISELNVIWRATNSMTSMI